ncbi:MAG: cadherin-like domain-containing protein, partial [Thermaceae bacterium]|nr:cadherin-like domain-containing protein [Thermaceae bacterium]
AVGSSNNSLTVALRVPQNGDPANTAYRYSMTFLIFEDSITRVTESLDEQAASGAATRASAISATQLEVMCGSSYSGTNPAAVFVPSVKTAGVGSAYSAWMGGNFAIINETPPSISVTGNVPKTFSDSALLGGYQALGGATLSANGFASTDTNLITDNTGSFTFTTQAGKRTSTNFTYKVSDGTCTSPAQPATANITGMYWFVNNSGVNGSGRFGSPFNTLAGAQTAAQAGDVIFVYRGNGSSSGQNSGITLQNNQSLFGEGVGLSVDDVNIAAGTNPVIGNSGGVGVTLAQNNTVQGLQIAGNTFGVSGTNPVSVTLKKLVVSGGSKLGSDGVNIGSSTGSNAITLQNSTLSNSGGYGVYLYSSSSAAVTLSVTGNTFQNNAGLALNTLLQGSGNSTFDFSNNTITNTTTLYGGIGVLAQASAAGTLYQGRVNNNTITLAPGTLANSAGSVGIDIQSLGAGNTHLQVNGNTVTGYDSYGIGAVTSGTTGGRLDLTLTNNTTTYANANTLAIRGFNLSAGTSGFGGPSTFCLNMSGNTTTTALPARLQQLNPANTTVPNHAFLLNGFSGSGTTVSAVQSFVAGLNPAATISVRSATSPPGAVPFVVVNYSTGTCTAPSF